MVAISPFVYSTTTENSDDDLPEAISNLFMSDFSRYGLDIYGKATSTETQKELCLKMIMSPVAGKAAFDRVLAKYVYSLVDEYTMHP